MLMDITRANQTSLGKISHFSWILWQSYRSYQM